MASTPLSSLNFLQRVVAGAKRTIVLIVDRGPAHSAKKTAAFDEPLGGKLRLFFLPRYSPNRNPDELAAIRLLCTLSRELASRFRGNDVALA